MAPKRKSSGDTPSKKTKLPVKRKEPLEISGEKRSKQRTDYYLDDQIIHDGDDSLPPSACPNLFRNLKAQKLLLKFKEVRKVMPGASVVVNDFKDWEFKQFFDFQGWTSFLCKSHSCCEESVQLFYANLKVTEPNLPKISSYVGCSYIELTPTSLATIFNLPNEGYVVSDFDLASFNYPFSHSAELANRFLHSHPSEETLHSVKSSDLRKFTRLFGNLLNWSIFSKTMRGEFRGCVKLVTYLVLNKIKVNLPKLILSHILGFTKGHGNLGYGMIICMILSHFKIPLGKSGFVKRAIFNAERARKMGISSACTKPPFDSSSSSSDSSSSDSESPRPSAPVASASAPSPSVSASHVDTTVSASQDLFQLVLKLQDSVLSIQDRMVTVHDLIALREHVDASESRILTAIRAQSASVYPPSPDLPYFPADVPIDVPTSISSPIVSVPDTLVSDISVPSIAVIVSDPVVTSVELPSPVLSPVHSPIVTSPLLSPVISSPAHSPVMSLPASSPIVSPIISPVHSPAQSPVDEPDHIVDLSSSSFDWSDSSESVEVISTVSLPLVPLAEEPPVPLAIQAPSLFDLAVTIDALFASLEDDIASISVPSPLLVSSSVIDTVTVTSVSAPSSVPVSAVSTFSEVVTAVPLATSPPATTVTASSSVTLPPETSASTSSVSVLQISTEPLSTSSTAPAYATTLWSAFLQFLQETAPRHPSPRTDDV